MDKNIHFSAKAKVRSTTKPRLHFVGVGGSGISGVAKLAEKMGFSITGCDLEASTSYLKNIQKGHSQKHLKDADLVVVSPALLFEKPLSLEVKQAKKRKILLTWQEFLGKFLVKNKKVICVAGTHGKSTTTAMIAKIMVDAGLDPTVLVGAKVPEWKASYRLGKGEYFVIEADEFNNNFLNYYPEIIVITNIEFDHPDFFKDKKQLDDSFRKFVGNLIGQKILITQKDSPHKKFKLEVLGQHNQDNANVAYLAGKRVGIPENNIIKSLANFQGIERRMELVADKNGIKVYDDYAHHPTAIKSTLEGLRQKYSEARILAIIEPHGFKRTKALLPLYKGVFYTVNQVFVGPIFKARDMVDKSITPNRVAQVSGHNNILGFNNIEVMFKNLKLRIKNYDIVVVMGAGKSYIWAREITNYLND